MALTGEGADESFGGYPWFHKKECLEAHTFPWTMDLAPRKAMLSDEFLEDVDKRQDKEGARMSLSIQERLKDLRVERGLTLEQLCLLYTSMTAQFRNKTLRSIFPSADLLLIIIILLEILASLFVLSLIHI